MTETRNIPFGRPWITDEERQAVMEVLQGNILTHGPQCKNFEEEFATFMGEGYAVSVASGMAALHLAYFQMGIGAGDEVIVPAQTHNATAHAVELTGARPIFADCTLDSGNIDPDQIKKLITPRTRAISLVHFEGIPCLMDEIMALASKHGLKVVEDCALAVGSRYKGKHVGLVGDVGCFSFYPVKHITTGEGGMFVTRHKDLAEVVTKQRAFGVDRTHSERSIPGYYDVTMLGLNYRMSEIEAAMGRVQLRRFPEILHHRRENFNELKTLLNGIENTSIIDSHNPDCASSFYCLSVLLHGNLREHRNEIVSHLNQAGVGTSIYYPHPVPRLAYYRNKYGYKPEDTPNAAAISDYSIALPVSPHLQPGDAAYIADQFKQAVKTIRN